MDNLSGCLIAKLAERDENYENHLIEEINSRIRPPRPISPADVYIRAMYIVSDQINSQGGCFAREELDHLVELLIDSPVMVGHQRDSLPLARNFLARRIDIDGRPWVKSYFYWMKESEGAEDLKNNIDGGIYKECSISFLFNLPECSICGRDIRECRHVPFQEYEVESGRQEIAHFKYRNIEKVLETSLVFRGAIPDTRITDQLSTEEEDSHHQSIAATHFFKISKTGGSARENCSYGRAPMSFYNIREFSPDESMATLYLSPYQPGICLRISKNKDNVELESSRLFPEKVRRHLTGIISENLRGSFVVDALLYAVKGKQRRSGLDLMRIIESGRQLHRLRIKICDIVEFNGNKIVNKKYGERQQRLKEGFADAEMQIIDLRKFRTCTRDNWIPDTAIQECARYNFGIEALAEDDQGLLSRYIISVDTLVPAIILEANRSGRGQMKCSLRTINGGEEIPGVICPGNAGLDRSTTALLHRRPSTGGKTKFIWSLADILPGCEKHQIGQPRVPLIDNPNTMYTLRGKNWIRMYLPLDEGWQGVTVYHYSAHLFKRGRRFIADMFLCEEPDFDRDNVERIPLKSIVRSEKMILMRPARKSQIFGDAAGMWLRPILIDGAERLLFHSEKVSCLPEEV